jgi:hypothetical protein
MLSLRSVSGIHTRLNLRLSLFVGMAVSVSGWVGDSALVLEETVPVSSTTDADKWTSTNTTNGTYNLSVGTEAYAKTR